MINSITIVNYIGESITMTLRNPEPSGFLVHFVDGLEPPKANIEMTEMSLMDGALYNSSRASSRNVVISIVFVGEDDIEVVRHRSYRYFPIGRPVTMLIETDIRTCQAYGYVESNDAQMFSKMCGTTITVRCPSAWLSSTTIDETYFHAIEPLFEFPFSNESLITNLIEFSSLNQDPIKSIFNSGDAETGIVLTIHAIGDIEGLEIYNVDTSESIAIDTDRLEELTGDGFGIGDDIIISTVKGDKYAKLVRSGVETNILNCLEKYPDWFQLRKGDNTFAFTATSGEDNVQLTFRSQVLYEGV